MFKVLIMLLALWVPNPPSIMETKDRVIHVEFPTGAEDLCVYVRRETKEEPDSNFPDGYYTPSDCTPLDTKDTNYESNIWDNIMPWYTAHNIPASEWTVWAEIVYPQYSGDLADRKIEIRKTPTYKVTR